MHLLFPCKAERRDRSQVAFGERRHDVRQYACEAGGMTFVAMVVPFDGSVPAAARQEADRALRAGVAANVAAAPLVAADPGASAAVNPGAFDAGGRRPAARPWPIIHGHRPDGQAVTVHAASWQGPGLLLHLAVVGDRPDEAAVNGFFEGLAVAR